MFGKKDLINITKGDVFNVYDKVKPIGEGGFAQVYLISHKKTKELRSLKRIRMANLSDKKALQSELKIMSKADNPSIINIFEVFITSGCYDIVMEYCKGGSLLDRINTLLNQNKCFSEYEAAVILRQLLSALNYSHKNGIVHRDIKLENVLFVEENPTSLNVKLIDFGLSAYFESGIKSMREKQGTCFYISPEILEGLYNEKCDVWACGVLLYILLIGIPPFGSEFDINEQIMYEKIRKFDYSYSNKYGIEISQLAKDFISKTLVPQANRPSAAEALSHPFIAQIETKKFLDDSDQSQDALKLQNIKDFVESSKIRKVILSSLATRLNYYEIEKLHEIFIELDQDNDGCISYQEFQNALKVMEKEKINLINKADKGKKGELDEYEMIFFSIDTDGSKKINYSEFIASAMDRKFYEDQNKLLEIFESLDANKDGRISISEFEKILFNNAVTRRNNDDSYESFRREFERYDLNHDGEIDYNEFVEIVTSKKDQYLPKKAPNRMCCNKCTIF